MTRIRLEDVTKIYGGVVAVDHANIDIEHGEFFTIIGPSGCGKTTTLRIIAGFEVPEEGKVYFDDRDVTYVKPYERNTAMVFQNYALWPHMTVYDNIAYGLRLRKVPEDEIRRRVEKVLDLVDLHGLENRYPLQLSGGQQQRVALARALVVEPSVLLLDEPLSNLDAKLRLEMREELRNLQKRLGITTVYVTHDQLEALSMSDRIAVMNKGRILQVGTPEELYMRPRNLFV
ncbi:MAG: ABC transporter ATP-binding protein, partial [Desulfurococcales archaeon]|nr:ABC transporter ATP-binding protein [Desulfurococcales archaeon]